MRRFLFTLSLAVVISCNKDETEKPPPGSSTATNKPPVAIAGPDMTITLPDTSYVILDGTRSYDPEKLLLTYKWTQLSGPPTLFFNDSFGKGEARASFGNNGTYFFQLTVTDARNAVYDTVEINVKWALDCNPNREIVSAESVGLGTISMKGSYAPSYAVGPNQLVLAGGTIVEPFWPGDPPATYSSSVRYYNMAVNAWSEWEMLRPKGRMGSVIAGDKLFLAGGVVDGGGITDEVEIHDIATKKITNAKLSTPRIYLAAAAAGNKVVFAGGSNNGVTATDMVDIFDITNNSWSSAKLSEPRMNMSALVNGNLIYFTGGASSVSGSGFSNTVDVFDAISGSWTVKKIGKSGSSLQTAMIGNKMVVAGGNTGPNSNFLNRLEFLDLASGSSSVDCMQFESYSDYGPSGSNAKIAVIGDKIYFGSYEFISMYNSGSKSWKSARLGTYYGIIYSYKDQLYGLKFANAEDDQGKCQVIRIGLQ